MSASLWTRFHGLNNVDLWFVAGPHSDEYLLLGLPCIAQPAGLSPWESSAKILLLCQANAADFHCSAAMTIRDKILAE